MVLCKHACLNHTHTLTHTHTHTHTHTYSQISNITYLRFANALISTSQLSIIQSSQSISPPPPHTHTQNTHTCTHTHTHTPLTYRTIFPEHAFGDRCLEGQLCLDHTPSVRLSIDLTPSSLRPEPEDPEGRQCLSRSLPSHPVVSGALSRGEGGGGRGEGLDEDTSGEG